MQPSLQHIASDCLIYSYGRLSALEHLQTTFEIMVPRNGRILASINGKRHCVEPGEILVLFPGVPHSYDPAEPSEGMTLIFTSRMLAETDSIWDELQPSEPVVRLSEADPDVAYCLNRLASLKSDANEALQRAYLSLMLLRLLPSLRPVESPAAGSGDLLYRAMRYMAQNLTSPLSLKTTAQALGVNTYYLSHVLNERLHMGFRTYLNALRINRARRYLRVTTRPIEEIAASCGFTNLRTFDRVFAERSGCTPREFRKHAQQRR